MIRKKKSPSSASSWLDSAVELPRETQVVNRDRQKQQKFYRRFIIASVILFPISLVANIGLLGNSQGTEVAAVSDSETDSESRAAATIAVRAWLASTPSPVPGSGQIVSWNTAVRVDRPVQTEKQAMAIPLPLWDIDVHNFTIVDSNGQTYSVDVQIAVDTASGSHAISIPSMTPITVDQTFSSSVAPWYGVTISSAPDSVITAINAWSNAYTSGDAAALRQAVGDTNGEHVYVPLGGVVSHGTEVQQSAELPAAREGDESSTMVVRVQLSIVWAGAPPLADGQEAPLTAFDLLIRGSNTAAPAVVAWVGPGLGLTATAYQNALDGRSGTIIIPTEKE